MNSVGIPGFTPDFPNFHRSKRDRMKVSLRPVFGALPMRFRDFGGVGGMMGRIFAGWCFQILLFSPRKLGK